MAEKTILAHPCAQLPGGKTKGRTDNLLEMQERLENALREIEDQRTILNFIEEGYLESDLRGNHLFANDAYCRIYNRTREEIFDPTYLDGSVRDLSRSLRELYDQVYKTGEPLRGLEYEYSPGQFAETTISLKRGANGEPTGFVTISRDVTERKRLELDVRQAHRLEAVGQLAAGIAHEINTPIQYLGDNLRFLSDCFKERQAALEKYEQLRLAAAAGTVSAALLEELQREIERADLEYLGDEIPKAISQSLNGVERVADIVRAMKGFAHPGQEEKAAADLNRALSDAVLVAGNELKYVADVETYFADLPAVTCHLAGLNQVFLNLLVNAADAIRDVVKDTGTKGRIEVRTSRTEDQVTISISDTGSGIPASVQARVFDPFFTTKEVGRGTGQGLSIARKIVVEKHGGRISFEPNGSRGTIFNVHLPIEPAQPSANSGTLPADAAA